MHVFPAVFRPLFAEQRPLTRRSFALSGFLASRRRGRAKNGVKWAKFGEKRETAWSPKAAWDTEAPSTETAHHADVAYYRAGVLGDALTAGQTTLRVAAEPHVPHAGP